MKTRSYFEEFLHLTNPRTLKEDVEIDVKEPVEDDTAAADGAVVAPIIDPEMGYDMGDADDTQVEQDGSAYIGKSVVDCHVCNNAFFIDGMEIPEELVCPVCAAPSADLELVGIVEPIPEEEPATTDNNDEQGEDSDDEDNDEDNVEESAGKADFYKKAKMAESNKHISKLTEGYDDLTVRELARILQDGLDILSGYNDEDVVVTESNTYGMYGNFVAVHGKGYVELDNINIEDDEDMYDEEDMDESLKKLKEANSSITNRFLVLDHDDPDELMFVKDVSQDALEMLEERDYIILDVTDQKGLALVEHNDEGIYIHELRKPLKQLDKEFYELLVKTGKEGDWEDIDDITEQWFEDNNLPIMYDYYNEDEISEYKNAISEWVNDSYVDGDSSSAFQEVDFSKDNIFTPYSEIFEDKNNVEKSAGRVDLTNEAINPENAKDNAVLKSILLGRGNKKLSAEEQAVLDKYGFKASDGGGSKLITNPATDNTIYLHTTRYTYDLYLANKETHRRIGSFDKDSTDPTGLNAVDLIGFLNSESEPMRDFTTKASRLNRNTDIARRTNATIRLYQEIVDDLEKRIKDAIASNADPDYIQKLQTRLDDRKEHLRDLQQTRSYSDKTAFAYRRYMDDTVNDNITAYKKLKRDLDYTQGRLKSAKDKIAASTSKWTIQQLQNEIAELQKQLDRALSGVGDEEDEQRVKDFEKRAQEIRAKIDNLFASVKRSTAESRQAMSKKIKDIYENRRAAQSTQVKKKSDLTNEAINAENAKDNAVLKNILLSNGNKELSAQEQAVLDKYGFIASSDYQNAQDSKRITNPITQNSIYLETTRNAYKLYLANKEGERKLGSFNKNSKAPKGLNAVDLISFLNSESEPIQFNAPLSDRGTRAFKSNRDIDKKIKSDILRHKKYIDELEKKLKDAVDANEDPNYIQKLQTQLDDYKKQLRKLEQDRSYDDKDAFAYRRYVDDTINDSIRKYKHLKIALEQTKRMLRDAKHSVEYDTSERHIQGLQDIMKDLQDKIAETQKQLDRAISGVASEDSVKNLKYWEKQVQDLSAEMDSLFAKTKRSAGSNN